MGRLELPPRYDIPTMQRIQTAWRPPWLMLFSSQQGLRHFGDGENCQDNHMVGGVGAITWMVLADGVSMSPRSEQGSYEACHAVHHYLGHALTSGLKPSKELVAKSVGVAHSALQDLARIEHRHIDDFGTTLAVALFDGDTVIAGAVGDSSVAVSSLGIDYENKLTRRFTPFCTARQSGQSGILDLTDPQWQQSLALSETRNPDIDLVFLATDGGHNFFLHPKGQGHAFDPEYPNYLLKHLVSPKTGPLLIGNVLAKFMQEIPAEGNDDRTILIATRVPDNLIPSAARAQ